MERSLIKQVNRKNMAARLKTNKVKPVYFPNFFGVKPKTSLKWETLTGEKGAPVIADVISFDSSAPQKTREVVAKMSGDIPKTAVKRGMNESEYNEYRQLQRDAQGDAAQLELLNLAFKDQDFVVNAVRGRFEWWCMQLMSKAGFMLSATNNAGIVTAEFVGCGMPATNKKVSIVDWATAATADGLGDIETVVLAASADGVTLKYAIMRHDDFIMLRNQKATTDRIKAWTNTSGKVVATLDKINEYMTANMLPQIVVINPAVKIENKAHKKVTVNPWESKRVCLIPDLNVGDIQHGPIASESSEALAKVAIMVKQDFVLTSKWSTLDPFKEWTMAEANAVPVINDPDVMYIIKADGAVWSENEDTEGTDKVPALFLGEEQTE